MGRSLGSAPAIELCVQFSEISCCVLESGYADPIPLVKRRGLHIAKLTPEENKLFNNSEKIRLVKCPILIMHGEDDFLIVPQEAVLNHQNAGSKHKELDILEGVGHNDMMMAHDSAYFKSLKKFFNNVFS
jgi:pimeloyl-ACP methyl ester carboxylesterase